MHNPTQTRSLQLSLFHPSSRPGELTIACWVGGSVVDVLNLRENLDLDDLLLLIAVLGQADRRLASRVQPRGSGHTRAGEKGVMHCLGACHNLNI